MDELFKSLFDKANELGVLDEVNKYIIEDYKKYDKTRNPYRRYNMSELENMSDSWIPSISIVYDTLSTSIRIYSKLLGKYDFKTCVEVVKKYYFLNDEGYEYYLSIVSEESSLKDEELFRLL